MTSQDFRAITALARRIEHDREQLLYLREKAASPPSTTFGTERVQNTVENRAGIYSDAAVDLERDIAHLEAQLRSLQNEAEPVIEAVSDSLTRRILRQRYLRLYSWEDIAEANGYTLRRIHQIESAAINGMN